MKESNYSSDEEDLQGHEVINIPPPNEQNLLPPQTEIELKPIHSNSLDETIKKLKEKEKTREIHNSYLFNIKDYIFFFFLMISSSINFSYLYLPFIFFGIIFILLIGNNKDCSKKIKFAIEILSLIYSILLIVSKIVAFILIKNENSYIEENRDLFLNLGVCYLRDKDSNFYLIMTFLGEGIMLVISLYGINISKLCGAFAPINDTSLMDNSFWENRKLILLNYIFILSFAVFNISYLTLFYMCVMQLVFFIDSLTSNRKKIQCFFKFICFLFTGMILTQISAINVLNIYKFQEDILKEEVIKKKDSELFEKVYSIWTQIGINYAYHYDLLYILKEWIGYLAAICSLVTLTFSINTIKVNELAEKHKNTNMNYRTAKTLLQQSYQGEKINNNNNGKKNEKIKSISFVINYIKEIIKNIYLFITSPVFIIQFSRVMSIFWMYFYRNFYSLGIFITVFFSFLFINATSNKFLTIFLLTPMVFVSLICFHFSNINGFFEYFETEEDKIRYMHFGLAKYEYSFLEYYAGNIMYIFIMFLIYSFFNSPKKEEDKNKNINLLEEITEKSSLLDINNSNKDSINKIKITLISEEGEKKVEKKEEKKVIQDLSLLNVILKYFFYNIDKITLIVMYLVAVKSINLIHLFLVIIFLVQILFPDKIKYLFEIILCLLQFLFLFELITDILKVYYLQEFNDNKDFMNFLLIYSEGLSDNNIEIFIYGVVYCFYFQYQIYNFPFLKRILENKDLTLANYVDYTFDRFRRIKHILNLIGNIILELYIWILIGLFVFVSCFFEINLIFAVKLAWFFILAFNFLRKIQNPENGVSFSAFWHALFLAFCCINTLSVYLYQFISDEYIYFYEDILNSKNFFLVNLPNIGFTMYNRDDLYYQFLPHFGIIFISVLFIFEIKSQLKKLKEKKPKEIKIEDNVKDEFEKKLKELKTEEERDLLKAKRFENNRKILRNLTIQYFFLKLMKIITKFYWLLLFFTIGIIFSLYDLSFSMIIYIIIFDITFIRMFHRIIKKLSDYISRPSYFISKVIRYTLVETPQHIKQNKYFRSIAFRYLLAYSFIFFIFLYLYGVFHLFQNGCNPDFFRGCEKRNEPIFANNGDIENKIKAYSFLFGIYVNLGNEGLMNVAWIHILLSALIGFDVYAQKLENKFTDDSENIKAQMQKINNENNTLYYFTRMADTNILIKLGLDLAGINNNNFNNKLNESINKIRVESRTNSEVNTGRQKSVQVQQEEEEINSVNIDSSLQENNFLQNNTIKLFINIFSKANDNQQTLSDTNNSTRLIWFLKKIFEEIIIFLLICIAITKLNILSFIYLIYSAYLTGGKKTMMKFYVLYCFLLVLILVQSIIYISNISEKTCPDLNLDLLELLKNQLNIPWYNNYLELEDKFAFFYGFGVNKTQVLLILLEFVQVMVIYIYLDFFSYSIYQDITNKGEKKEAENKFNFATIKLTKRLKEQVINMEKPLFEQYRDCLRNNFHFDIGETLDIFKNKLNIHKPSVENEDKINEEKNDILMTNNEELNKLISYKVNSYKNREKSRKEGTDNIPDSDFVKSFTEIIYLYLHILILLLIIIVSLMITGLLSIFYIIICFLYLINSDKIYLGRIYGYPQAIKRLLKICVIVDITLQIIYQIPYLSPDQDSVFQKIFDVLGLIKLIDYEAENNTVIKLISESILEVIGKPFIYFFLSLQIIIYNSKDFKKYYLTFLLNQKFEFTKNSLINTFRFNNDRIDAFKNSMNLRLKSEKAMEELKDILEEWNKKLKIGGGNLFEEPKKKPLEFIREKEKEKEEEEKNNITNENERSSNLNNEKINEGEKRLLKSIGEKGAMGLFDELKKINRKIIEPNDIKEKIRKILLNGYILKFYLWFSKHSIYYKSIPEKKKKNFEKNCILGNLEMKSYLETELDKQLEILDLSDFDDKEVEIVEDFFLKYKKGKIKKELEKKNKEIKKIKLDIIEKQIKKQREEQGMGENENNNYINNNEVFVKENDLNKIQVVYNIEKGDIKINTNTLKFQQFETLLDTKLFRVYLHTSYQIKSIIKNLESFLCNNFNYFCYLIMIIDHMINSSLLTMFYPLSIFCYALLENPQPKKIYWQVCICYTVFVLGLKFFFQLKLFNTIFGSDSYSEFLNVLYNYKIGITYFEVSFGLDFFSYIALDAFVLIILSLNKNILISNGLWENREEQIENIYTANERVEVNKDRIFKNREDEKDFIENYIYYKPKGIQNEENQTINNINNIDNQEINNIDNQEITNINNQHINNIDNQEINTNSNQEINTNTNLPNDDNLSIIKIENEKKTIKKLKFNTDKFAPRYDEGNRTFFEKLFPKIRNEKPGDDFYPFYAMSLALVIVYILFFFTKMDQDKTYGPVNLDTTQFSGNMVLFLLLHVIILVYDRAIYISQNKNHLKYRYFIYKKNDKGEGEIISREEKKEIKERIREEYSIKEKKEFFIPPSAFEQLNSENYNLFYVQTELFNKPLLHKYILHIISTVVCHIFVFIYFPMRGNYNLLNTIYCLEEESCNDFTNNAYTIIFYLLYLIYLYLSSIQIRLGYFDIKRKSLFKNNNTFTNTFSKIFNAIPFLPELRNTIDWTFTSTCLDLFKWYQFESIYDTIFDTYCDAEGNDEEEIGEKVSKKKKFVMGGLLSFGLVFILVIPLVLFSSLNPTNKLNNLNGAKLIVDLIFTYENGVELKYNLFENSRAKTISDMFKDGESTTWEVYNYDKSVQTRNFQKPQIQIVEFSETSDRNWDLAEPHIKDLIELLNITEDKGLSTIELSIETQFSRPLPAEAQTVSQSFSINIIDSSEGDPVDSEGGNKILTLKSALEECKEAIIEFEEVYSPPLRITAGEEVSEISDSKYIKMKDVQLGFQGCKKEVEIIGNNETIEINSYLKSYFTFKTKDSNGIWKGLEFHVFNDKISETTSGYSVLTFYLTFVLVAGSYVQEFLASEPEKIMFTELPHPESIVNLCEGIKISRYSYDFKKEEYLYTILIELMRSPDYLKLLTQSSIDHFKLREQNTHGKDDDDDDNDNDNKKDKDKKKSDSDSDSDSDTDKEDESKNNNKEDVQNEYSTPLGNNNNIDNYNDVNQEDQKEDQKEDPKEEQKEDNIENINKLDE